MWRPNLVGRVAPRPDAPRSARRATIEIRTLPEKHYSPRNTFAADFTVASMSRAVCAVEMKPASNCDGAR